MLEPRVFVAEHSRQRAAGVELESFRRVYGDLGILLSDLTPQPLEIHIRNGNGLDRHCGLPPCSRPARSRLPPTITAPLRCWRSCRGAPPRFPARECASPSGRPSPDFGALAAPFTAPPSSVPATG